MRTIDDLDEFLKAHVLVEDGRFDRVEKVLDKIQNNELVHLKADIADVKLDLATVKSDLTWIKKIMEKKDQMNVAILVGVALLILTSLYKLIAK